MNVIFPIAPRQWSTEFINQVIEQMRRAFNSAVSKDEETPRVILRSPNGSNFDLTVSDAGVLVVTPTASLTRGVPGA